MLSSEDLDDMPAELLVETFEEAPAEEAAAVNDEP